MQFPVQLCAEAQALFVTGGLTQEEISTQLAVPPYAVRMWSKKYRWATKRDQFGKALMDRDSRFLEMQEAAIDLALKFPDPQNFMAANKLLDRPIGGLTKGSAQDQATLFLRWIGDLISFLKVKSPEALRHLAPHLQAFADFIKHGQKQKEIEASV